MWYDTQKEEGGRIWNHYFCRCCNIFTGSYGRLRFRVTPNIVMLTQKEVNFDESSMKCECWHGEYCYEKSQMEDEKTFPLNEAAYHEMYDWISAHI